jgi:hypothetical protein
VIQWLARKAGEYTKDSVDIAEGILGATVVATVYVADSIATLPDSFKEGYEYNEKPSNLDKENECVNEKADNSKVISQES